MVARQGRPWHIYTWFERFSRQDLYAGDYIKKLFTEKAINVYDPTSIKQDWTGTYTENKTYQNITENIQSWIEYAIKLRNYYPK